MLMRMAIALEVVAERKDWPDRIAGYPIDSCCHAMQLPPSPMTPVTGLAGGRDEDARAWTIFAASGAAPWRRIGASAEADRLSQCGGRHHRTTRDGGQGPERTWWTGDCRRRYGAGGQSASMAQAAESTRLSP
jgi:hypothetical protein